MAHKQSVVFIEGKTSAIGGKAIAIPVCREKSVCRQRQVGQ